MTTSYSKTSAYNRLVERLKYIADIKACGSVAEWDAETLMPAAGGEFRARQLSIIGKLAHNALVSRKTRSLIERAEAETSGCNSDTDQAHMVRLARYDYERAIKLPARFVAEVARATSLAPPAWGQAREENNFSLVRPHLQILVDLMRRKADYHGF